MASELGGAGVAACGAGSDWFFHVQSNHRGQQGKGTEDQGVDDEGMYLVRDQPEDRFKAAADFMRRCVWCVFV